MSETKLEANLWAIAKIFAMIAKITVCKNFARLGEIFAMCNSEFFFF